VAGDGPKDNGRLLRQLHASGHGLRRPLAAGWRLRVRSTAQDVTLRSGARSSLVVAAHPADEVLGCGGVIARKRAAGTEVDVLVVTDGRHLTGSRVLRPSEVAARLRDEAVAAAAMLGVDAARVHLAGYEAGTLRGCQAALAAAITKLLVDLDPADVFAPSPAEAEDDRRAVHQAVRRALLESGSPARLLGYRLDSWSDPPTYDLPVAGEAEVVCSDRFRYLKQAALEAYPTRTTNPTGEFGWDALSVPFVALLTGPAELFFIYRGTAREPVATPSGASERPGAPAAGRARAGVVEEAADRFETPSGHSWAASRGRVIGSNSTSGATRQGVDAEGTISLHDSRLRFDPLRKPGWGRQGVAYGPFERRPGLAFVSRVLSSHHNAHTDPPPRGPRSMLGKLRHTWSPSQLLLPAIEDNLLVGFHDVVTPAHAAPPGNGFILHAGGNLNGELRARVAGHPARLHLGVHEVPVTYVVVLREQGATYYVAGPPGADGLGPWPELRPVAVDHLDADALLFAGVHQSVHAEGGHEMATSVDELRVSDVPSLRAWYGGAAGADSLTGHGPLDGTPADVGGSWTVVDGDLVRAEGGVAAVGQSAEALMALPSPAGLVHVLIQTAPVLADEGWAGLCWRCGADGRDGWRVRVWSDHATAEVGEDGRWEVVAEGPARLAAARVSSLQVVDDGTTIGVHLDGRLLFDRWIVDERHATRSHVGLAVGPEDRATLRAFEAHLRSIPVPAELDLSAPWDELGTVVALADGFAGPPGDLDNSAHPAAVGADRSSTRPAWKRSLGLGQLELTGAGSLRVRADRHQPNLGRTLYTTAWDDPTFADLEVDLVPPGTARSQGHGSRGGLVLWQDTGSYVVVNLWVDDSPTHDGSAVSLFCCSGGHERIANAVWANVGRRATWGRRSTLRVVSDGEHLVVRLDGQPVLQRRIRDLYPWASRLSINRVGLAVNREWGDDTGTIFSDFRARRRA
jgi:LmbE family N-acetylglucosaminyl deacetylase